MQSRNSALHPFSLLRQLAGRARLASTIGFALFLALSGLGQIRTASAAPVLSFVVESIDCGSVTGIFSWSDIPIGVLARVALHGEIDIDGNVFVVDVDSENDRAGELRVTIPFQTSTWGGWHLKVNTYDNGIVEHEVIYPTFERECVTGSVSPGGTGEVEGEPVDARSGVTSEPEDDDEVEDPDGEGRVQIP
jgi:hypothetical protein